MKKLTQALVFGMIVAGGIAYAQTAATDPTVIARQDLMKSFGGAAKVLGGMASGEVAFDAAAAEAAKATLVTGSVEIAVKFTDNPSDPGTKAKPEIWTGWDAFVAKAKGLNDAATALDVASAESIGAGMGAVGGACKACHTDYRM
ncbi:cytochrome c [Paracoccaceae bacterium]